MAAACGQGCGWCGRCTAAWEDEEPIGFLEPDLSQLFRDNAEQLAAMRVEDEDADACPF